MRHIGYEDVIHDVEGIFRRNSRFCKFRVRYSVDSRSDNGETWSDIAHPPGSIGYTPIQVRIGVKTLEENIDENGTVRADGFRC